MADIKIIPNNEDLILNFNFNSPQQFFYNVAVINKNNDQQIFHASGKWDGTKTFTLGKAKDMVGLGLIIYWAVIDPAGAGNNFEAEAVVTQNNLECLEHQVCKGITNDNSFPFVNTGTFITK